MGFLVNIFAYFHWLFLSQLSLHLNLNMYIEQLYTGCLSEAAYYIESDGEAAIIDPLRDIDEYLASCQ